MRSKEDQQVYKISDVARFEERGHSCCGHASGYAGGRCERSSVSGVNADSIALTIIAAEDSDSYQYLMQMI